MTTCRASRRDMSRFEHCLLKSTASSRKSRLILVGPRPTPHYPRSPSTMLDGPLLSHHDFLLQRMIGAGQMGKVYQSWQHSAVVPSQ